MEDELLLVSEGRIPFAEREGLHSLSRRTINNTELLTLPSSDKNRGPSGRCSISSSETVIQPVCIIEDFFCDTPYWIQKEFKDARLQSRENVEYRDLGVEKRNKVECKCLQQQVLFTSCKVNMYKDNSVEARIIVDLLKFHTRQEDLCNGIQIHAYVVKKGFLHTNMFVGCALLNIYAKCGALAKAQQLFDEFPVQNLVSWNALIAGYTQHGHYVDALSCFEQMQLVSISPNAVTFTCILNACGNLKASDKGQDIHARVIKAGSVGKDIVLANALVDMYAKCGLLAKAQEVLEELTVRDVVSYTALIVGYAQLAHTKEAFHCFKRMQQEGISPNIVTFVGVLKACGSSRAGDIGRRLHAQFVIAELLDEDNLFGTAMVDMYTKCGSLLEAQDVFDELSEHDVVLWNVLIAGYVENEHDEEALYQFKLMQAKGFSPNAITFVSILKACGNLAVIDKGQDIHTHIVQVGLASSQLVVGTGLVDMYANCAMLAEAQEIFNKLPVRNVVSWSALMEGYGQQGREKNVFHLLKEMMREGIEADLVIHTIILNTCSHGGLLDKGETYFETLYDQFDVLPTLEHYTCMVDLLGRAGHIEKAMAMIEEMHFSANLTLWHILLGACRKWEYVKLGRWVFQLAIQLDEKDAETYACMCNVYT